MPKPKIITLRQADHIPIDRLRTYAEKLIEKLPDHFESFEKMDEYTIFYPRMKRKDRKRICMFRGRLIYTMRSVLGTRAAMQDLAMIFRMSGHSTATSSMRSAEKHNTSSNALKDEMVKICESDGHNALLGHEETHVRVSCIMDQEKWECLIPKEYLEFATSIFNALEQEEGINREVLCATKRGGDDFILFRDVFIFVFCRKYSDATEKFLAYILGRSYHSPISHSFYRQSHYLDPATQKSDEAIRFNTLVEKIKKKVL